MKKTLLNILIGLVVVGVITIGSGMAQGTPPDIKVNLSLSDSRATDKLLYLLDDPATPANDPDRIETALTFKNNGGTGCTSNHMPRYCCTGSGTGTCDVITSQGFSSRPFHLQLVFTDPDGKIISANNLADEIKGEPEPPPVISVNGQLLQVEPVETLPNGWVLNTTIPDVHVYYSLTKAGLYSVKARIPMRTYTSIDHTVSGVDYSDIDKSNWADKLESNPVFFYITADNDKDGYYYPMPYGQHAEPDCNDNNFSVHPGTTEIQGNGIDDDCDPSTSDGGIITRVNVLNPNGGDIVPSGSSYAVRWVAPPNAVKFDLKYSMNNGTTWKPIANKVTGTSFNWTAPIPKNNRKKCLVKVIGYNAVGTKIGDDTSDDTFTIEVIKVTSPDGGETLSHTYAWTIRWRTNGTMKPVAFSILYYTQDGSTWKLISPRIDNLGYYPWEVPYVPSAKTKCKVKVVLKAADGTTVGSDISDTFFTIQP